MEAGAMETVRSLLGKGSGQKLKDLWQEYEDGTSPEAKLLKDLDKVSWRVHRPPPVDPAAPRCPLGSPSSHT